MPARLQSLSARLQSLSDALKTTLQLVNRLAKLNFQPGSQPLEDNNGQSNGNGNGEGGEILVELSSEIHESLKAQEEQLELLRQEVEDFVGGEAAHGNRGYRRESERDREKQRLNIQIARLGEDIK
jgi:protein transport protein SEC20